MPQEVDRRLKTPKLLTVPGGFWAGGGERAVERERERERKKGMQKDEKVFPSFEGVSLGFPGLSWGSSLGTRPSGQGPFVSPSSHPVVLETTGPHCLLDSVSFS